MSVSVSVAGPYFSSGSISFSSLRSTFKGTSSGEIRASEYRRNTSIDTTDPIVPDSTENSAVSFGFNLALSQFRNTIKYYYMTQNYTDINFNINSQSWNSNIGKNIRKWLYINGTCGSTSTGSPAAQLDSGVNITITVNGGIYGAGGSAGGGNGGNGFAVYGTRNTAIVMGSGVIFAGGGGGGNGQKGLRAANALCYYYTYPSAGSACGGCPGCGSNELVYCWDAGECDCVETCTKKGGCETVCTSTVYVGGCRQTNFYEVIGGEGGEGGGGGQGQGYGQSRTDGSIGEPGKSSSCAPNNTQTVTTGERGQTGGNGGDWGQGGEGGGYSGTALYGSNYTVSGANGYNIRGSYSAPPPSPPPSNKINVTFYLTRDSANNNTFTLKNKWGGGESYDLSVPNNNETRYITLGLDTNAWYVVEANGGSQSSKIQRNGKTIELEDATDNDYNDLRMTPNTGYMYTLGNNQFAFNYTYYSDFPSG